MDHSKFPHHRSQPVGTEGERSARFLDALGAPALTSRNPDGSVSRKVLGRLYVDPGEPVERVTQVSRMAWVPEGMVITPRSAAAPNGWGLPPTGGLGTVGGDFPYVVINHYQHNNTPEYLHSVYSDAPRMDAEGVRMALNWPANYMDAEAGEIGAWQGKRFLSQFVGRWVPLLKEKRQAGWFCHRPEVRPWPFGMMPAVFAGVNAVRAVASLPPVSPPLVGWTADLAQAVVSENLRAKLVEHDSETFRPGWRTLTQRVQDRAGQLVSAGENLYASYGTATGAELGNETVASWTTSPPHYAVMTYDYTEGLRATRTTAGTAQLTAEVMTQGTWPRADLGLPERGKEVAAVLTSADARGPRCTTWRHPQRGSISVNTAPGTFAFLPTRNLIWSESVLVSYRHTELEVARNSEAGFLAGREQVLGAALCAVEGGAPIAEAAWAGLIAEKQRREVRYGQRRAAAELPPDTACVGSEAGLVRADSGQILKLRTLHYEESGTPRAAPNGAATTCRLVLYEGNAADFLATRTVLKSFTLPFNPVNVGAAARFSEDGHRVVVTCAEHIADPSGTGRWDGERLHFYEFVDDVVTEVGTAEMDIAVVFPGESYYEQSAEGRCHLYPFYDGDTLQFIDMVVNHFGSTTVTGPDTTHARTLSASLAMPGIGALNWVYTATSSSGSHGATEGYVRHLLHLDPMQPERTHWVEFSLHPVGDDATQATARVMRNMAAPETVRTIYAETTPQTVAAGYPWLVPMLTDKRDEVVDWVQRVHPFWPYGGVPTTDFKATFGLGTVGLQLIAGAGLDVTRPGYGGTPGWAPRTTPLAPSWWFAVDGFPDTLSDANTDDAYVLAGSLPWLPFGVGLPGAAGGARYFRSSSLDLEAVTGIEDLSDNILPIWSL